MLKADEFKTSVLERCGGEFNDEVDFNVNMIRTLDAFEKHIRSVQPAKRKFLIVFKDNSVAIVDADKSPGLRVTNVVDATEEIVNAVLEELEENKQC